MTSASYRFGLLLVVFGGFLSLNSARFGGTDSVVAGIGMLTMVVGLLIGVLGLAGAGANGSP